MRTDVYKKLFFPTLLSYIVLCFLLAANCGEEQTSFEVYCKIFGGIRAGNLSDNLTKLMQWLLSFLPLLVFVGVQFSEELSGRLYFTLIRSKSVLRWWNSWITHVMFISVVFSVTVFMSGFFAGIVFGEIQEFRPEIEKFLSALYVSAVYNAMLSTLMLCLGVWLKGLKWSIAILMLIIFGCYILGKFIPSLNPYLFATFSMPNRSQVNDNVYGFDSRDAHIIMLLITVIAYFIGIVGAKRTIRNI